jgi:anti-sigma factor RsiW
MIMRRLLRHRRLVCRQAVELMTAYLEGTLPRADAERLERHLDDCPHCTEYLAQLRVTIDALGRVEPDSVDDPTLDGLVDLYRRWRTES